MSGPSGVSDETGLCLHTSRPGTIGGDERPGWDSPIAKLLALSLFCPFLP